MQNKPNTTAGGVSVFGLAFSPVLAKSLFASKC